MLSRISRTTLFAVPINKSETTTSLEKHFLKVGLVKNRYVVLLFSRAASIQATASMFLVVGRKFLHGTFKIEKLCKQHKLLKVFERRHLPNKTKVIA